MIGAFFDIDGTLYRDSLMVEHFKKLIKYEVVDPAIWHNKAKKAFHDWDKRTGNYDDYLLELAAIYVESMKGLKKNHIDFITNQVIHLKGDRVYKFTRERIAWHKEQGHAVIFISGSPDYLVSKMAKKYDVTDSQGTEYLVDKEEYFTGEIIQMWDSSSKKKAIHRFVAKYNLDLNQSYAYGDTHGDLGMFELVAHPIAINPVKELLCAIKSHPDVARKTQIIVERKDVIYKFTADVEFL